MRNVKAVGMLERRRGGKDFLTDSLSIQRFGWDATEEENWAERKFFRGPLGQLVTPALCPFQGNSWGRRRGRREGQRGWRA